MRGVLEEISNTINSDPDIRQVNMLLGMDTPVLAWVDDVCIPAPSVSVDAQEDLLRKVLCSVIDVFQSYGLRLNFKAGKIEIVCQLRGVGSVAARRRLFVDGSAMLQVKPDLRVRLVTLYKHLGLLYMQNLSQAHDIEVRIGRATTQFRQLSKPVLLNKCIAVPIRLQLLEALVFPMIFYGSGSWTLLNPRIFKKLDHFVTSLQRRIVGTGFWSTDRISDRWFQAMWKLPSLGLRLAKHRLLYALQMYHKAPPALLQCVLQEDHYFPCADDTWVAALRSALRWYVIMCPECPLAMTQLETEAILTWLQESPSTEPAHIRTAVKRALLQERTIHQVYQGHKSIFDFCVRIGAPMDFAPDADDPVALPHRCDECGRSFSTPQGLNAHRWTMHQQISLERKYVRSGTCLVASISGQRRGFSSIYATLDAMSTDVWHIWLTMWNP